MYIIYVIYVLSIHYHMELLNDQDAMFFFATALVMTRWIMDDMPYVLWYVVLNTLFQITDTFWILII